MIPVIIPARGGSKGIPRKNVRLVAGKPLIVHNIEAARAASCVSSVWVSTDDEEIAAVSEAAGAQVIRRPAEFATDRASSESALLHALEELERRGLRAEVFAFMQCTSPLTRAEDLEAGYRRLVEAGADCLLSVTASHRFLWRRSAERRVEGVNHDPAFRPRRQDRAPEYAENGAFYLMKWDGFRAAKHRFFGRVEMLEMPGDSAFEIDEPEDLDVIELLLERRQRRAAGAPSAVDVRRLKAIVFDFDGVFTDDRVWVDQDGRESAVCSRRDGLGIELLRKRFKGELLILSKEVVPIVQHRAKKLRLECIHGAEDKLTILRRWAAEKGLELSEIAFIGNDINDQECLEAVGLGVVPADAHPSVRTCAGLRLSSCGGRGALREFCDLVLRQLQ